MPQTTMTEIYARVAAQLCDPSNSLFTTTEILDAWYDGVLKYAEAMDHWVKRDTTTIDTVASTLTSTLPTDFIREMSVTLIDSSSEEIALVKTTRQELDGIETGWRTADTGQPTKYYIFGQTAIGWYPVPDAAYNISIEYVYYPASSATDPLVPVQHRSIILNYVFAVGYQKKLENTQADKFFGLFEAGLAKAKSERKRTVGQMSSIRDTMYLNYSDI